MRSTLHGLGLSTTLPSHNNIVLCPCGEYKKTQDGHGGHAVSSLKLEHEVGKFFSQHSEIIHLCEKIEKLPTTSLRGRSETTFAQRGGRGVNYSLVLNTSHGTPIQDSLNFPPNSFIPTWSLSKKCAMTIIAPWS